MATNESTTRKATEARTTRRTASPEGSLDNSGHGLPADAIVDDDLKPGIEQMRERFNTEQEQGYRGTPADPTPNEHYTLQGVTDPNKHVPEEFKTQTGVTVMPTVPDEVLNGTTKD